MAFLKYQQQEPLAYQELHLRLSGFMAHPLLQPPEKHTEHSRGNKMSIKKTACPVCQK